MELTGKFWDGFGGIAMEFVWTILIEVCGVLELIGNDILIVNCRGIFRMVMVELRGGFG